jgi:hypothetical protein
MTRIAVTGYVNLPDDRVEWVTDSLRARLVDVIAPGWRGITCLARGVDQLFAGLVLALHGSLQVVLPALDYELNGIDDGNRERFRALLAQADAVDTLPYPTSDREAYLAASEEMLRRCDLLLAVWDGNPSRQMGDTADVVRRAGEMRIPVTIIWPDDVETGRDGVPARPVVTPAAVPDRG